MGSPDSGRVVIAVHPGAELFGSDRMFLQSVIGLRERGVDVIAVLASAGPLVEQLRAAGAQVDVIPMMVLRKSFRTPLGLLRLFAAAIRNVRAATRLIDERRPDAVYVSTAIVPVWPVVARLKGVRIVSHLHEAEASAGTLMKKVLYTPHRPSHAVIVNSRFTRETMLSSAPRIGSRTNIVYNGVSGPPVSANPPRPRVDDGLRVLYIGRLSPRKGPDVLIEALAIARDEGLPCSLRLLGSVYPGYEWFEDQLRARVDLLGLHDQVEFAGFDSDIWPSLAAADVLVVPSVVDEPFGNTAVEGLLARRPVIVSDTSGLREAAGGYPTALLTAPGDAAALATALQTVRASWASLCRDVAISAATAEQRNGIAAYRAAVATSVLGADERIAAPAR
ncbi:glycosyltransferase [Microbacterium sp. zg.Y1090]|uniref:glycosyltransferase n=1 Tax=Microbacterium TaxID=33882 RepID=UPI00214B1ADB|nr:MULTISPECIES: glycosyltransferase [unclassified Microbacterium]MCR2814119.1 glycosyltransferase [Microbacterium sp. zg.Y1084]MCR2817876.1 glycosyltransferase [Microbacterium sp. zg.Y1090]MDL5487730.1 glycosyltransferase [Microbacterium sp. zg-Y1211]WIM27954.1 glycosyltransferase [Microbacterium sp. zg-Y1090]